MRLAYGPGATITRLNKGLRRRAEPNAARLQDRSGLRLLGEERGRRRERDATIPTASPRQWIVPSVQDRKNALLFQPIGEELSRGRARDLQHALLRGIEAVFQLEEGEILAEPMPTRDARNGFLLYEATEGGAGVLTRLVAEPTPRRGRAQGARRSCTSIVGDGPASRPASGARRCSPEPRASPPAIAA